MTSVNAKWVANLLEGYDITSMVAMLIGITGFLALLGLIRSVGLKSLLLKAKRFINVPGTLAALIVFGFFIAIAFFLFTNIQDAGAYWASIALFVVGGVISYHMSQTAGFDGALSHFREVIIGSTNIGLTSIKKLSDMPPDEMVKRSNHSLQFIGVAGGKFLKNSLDTVDFFRTNQTSSKVRFILMDPFSKDIERLVRDPAQQHASRQRIIKSLIDLAEKERQGYRFEVRLYPKVPPLRLMICDGAVTAMSVYTLETSGWKNAQLVFEAKNCPESLAPHFHELFDDLWERALGFNLNLRAEALKGLLDSNLQATATPVPLGMVHGRFQPFHHEHLEYILHGITHSEKCIIGITQPNTAAIIQNSSASSSPSSAPHRSKKEGNPYSYPERRDMIDLSLKAMGIPANRYEIIEFDVDNADTVLPSLLSQYNPDPPVQFVKIFSDWELHKKANFERHGFEVRVIRNLASQYSPKNVSGTLVRELISSKRNWADFVPSGSCAVIRSHRAN